MNASTKDRKDPSPDIPEAAAATTANTSSTSAAAKAESQADSNTTVSVDKHVENKGKGLARANSLRYSLLVKPFTGLFEKCNSLQEKKIASNLSRSFTLKHEVQFF